MHTAGHLGPHGNTQPIPMQRTLLAWHVVTPACGTFGLAWILWGERPCWGLSSALIPLDPKEVRPI